MEDNARKYKLNVEYVRACGLGALHACSVRNILNPFTFDGCNYPLLSTYDLSMMNRPDYLKRVGDYISFLNIEDSGLKEQLYEEASFYDPTCIVCRLNPDFLVYKFLTGVRVVNVGEGHGVLQYKAYPVGANSEDYVWQENPTFLDVNLTLFYVFEVRDLVEGDVYCSVQKTVPLPTLVPSTTVLPTAIKLSIIENTYDHSASEYYSVGVVKFDPNLVNDETVILNYSICAETFGSSVSCAHIYCKPYGCSTYLSHCCVTGNKGIKTATANINAGDSICYVLSTTIPSPGACGSSYFKLDSVDSSNTRPTIDISKCCISRCSTYPKIDTTINITEVDYSDTTGFLKRCGDFVFTPALIDNSSVELELGGDVEHSLSTSVSNLSIYCKPKGGTTYENLFNIGNEIDFTCKVNVNAGDSICYNMVVNAGVGDTASVCMFINNAIGSSAINPIIGDCDNTSLSETVDGTAYSLSLCCSSMCVCNTSNVYNEIQCGHINISPELDNNECVDVCICMKIYTSEQAFNLDADVGIICNGIIIHSLSDSGVSYGSASKTQTITMEYGDCWGYCISACSNNVEPNNYPACSSAEIYLTDAIGCNGACPSIIWGKDNEGVVACIDN